MKALTVQQPWAWALIHGGKDVENRTQAWSYRGPLAIHTGTRWSNHGGASELVRDAFGLDPRAMWPTEPFHSGAIIGVVDLVDVHHHVGSGSRNDCCSSPWAQSWRPGDRRVVHLVVENPRPLEVPIPCKGRLGLWTPPADVLEQLQAVAHG